MIMKKCAFPTCRERIPARTKGAYCEQHKRNGGKQHWKEDDKYRQFYRSSQWRKLRIVAIAKQHGLCEECLKNGDIVKGDVVHHIKPIKTAEGWERRLDLSNLVYICHMHHNLFHPEKGGKRNV